MVAPGFLLSITAKIRNNVMEDKDLNTSAPINKSEPATAAPGWRNPIPVDPFAAAMPPISPEGLAEMAADMQEAGIQNEVAIFRDADGKESVLDGCNRLDAAEAAGLPI